MSLPRFALSVLCIAFLSLTMMPDAYAQSDTEEARTIHVNGEATVQVQPDKATVRFGVVTRAETAEEARSQNSAASSAALEAVRDIGIAEERIRMEQLQLRPHRVHSEERRRMVEDGFEAVRSVRVEVHDIDQVPLLITRIVEAGANRLQSVEYDVQNRETARNDALSQAARNAKAKADRLAGALEVQVGAVHTIREQNFSFPRSRSFEVARVGMMSAEAAEPDPEAYAPGEIEVEAQVSIVFYLTD